MAELLFVWLDVSLVCTRFLPLLLALSLFLYAGASDWKEAQVLGRQDVWSLLVYPLLQPEGDTGQAGDVESQVHRVVSDWAFRCPFLFFVQ